MRHGLAHSWNSLMPQARANRALLGLGLVSDQLLTELLHE